MNISVKLLKERDKLHRLILSNAKYDDILRQSEKVDRILSKMIKNN